jgi:methyl-accepting chemotaxis protein
MQSIRTSQLVSSGLLLILLVIAAWVARLLTHSITGRLNQAVVLAQNIATGDLTGKIDVIGSDEIAQLLSTLQRMQASLMRTVAEVRHNAQGVVAISEQISQGNLDLSARTEQQASSLEETASSMEQLSSTVQQNADNSGHANQLARTASATVLKGGSDVNQVVDTMQSIEGSSRKIFDNQMDQLTQQNAALVQESARGTQRLKDQAERLLGVVQIFKVSAEVESAVSASAVVSSAPVRPVNRLPVRAQRRKAAA